MTFKIRACQALRVFILIMGMLTNNQAAVAARENETKTGDIKVFQFDNGLKLIYRRNTKTPLVAMHLFLPTGVKAEPENLSGVFSLMSSVMVKGTKTRDAAQIAYELESTGSSLSISASEDNFIASGTTVDENFEKLASVFTDVLLNPSFHAGELEKERAATLAGIKSKEEHIFTVAHELLNKEIYNGHPYGRPVSGTLETVARITQQNLSDSHTGIVNPKGAVLVVVGSPSLRRVKKVVHSQLVAQWKAGEESIVNSSVGTVKPIAVSKEIKEKRHFEQTYYMTGYIAPSMVSGDYAVTKVLNVIVGGGMGSRLFTEMREARGIGYEVSSFYPSREESSQFVIYIGLENKRLAEAETAVKGIVNDILEKGPNTEEVDNAIRYITGLYWMDHQTISRQAWYLGWWEITGKGYVYDTRYPDDLKKITREDVHKAAREILGRPNITVKINPPQ